MHTLELFFTLFHTLPLYDSHLNTGFLNAELQANWYEIKLTKWLIKFNLTLGYGKTQNGYRCYDHVSNRLHISRNVVFWEHFSFIELSHFHAFLSTSSILDLFSDEPHISSIVASDPPIDFSIQPPDIFDASPRSPFNEQVEDEYVKDEPPNPKLGSTAPALPKNLT